MLGALVGTRLVDFVLEIFELQKIGKDRENESCQKDVFIYDHICFHHCQCCLQLPYFAIHQDIPFPPTLQGEGKGQGEVQRKNDEEQQVNRSESK